jgi:hypothetical protein
MLACVKKYLTKTQSRVGERGYLSFKGNVGKGERSGSRREMGRGFFLLIPSLG